MMAIYIYILGDFYVRPKETAPKMGERAPTKKPVDNLTSFGDKFYEKPVETYGPGERRSPIKQSDNLRPEGKFYSPQKEDAPLRGERAPVKKPVDQFPVPEGKKLKSLIKFCCKY